MEHVRKPMASVQKVTLFEREIRWKLSSAAIEILFDCAEVLSEGELRDHGYFGSTMITIDLRQAAPAVREACDAESARRVAELFAKDPRVAARARAMASAAATSRTGSKLGRLDVDLKTRASGSRIHIDLDVEAESKACAASRP